MVDVQKACLSELPVFILEIWDLRYIGLRKMAQKEGALPIQVIDLSLNTLETFGCHKFLEPLLHTLLVVLLCHPLHGVH